MRGEQNQIESMLLRPLRERRIGTTDEHRETGVLGGGRKHVPCLAQLDLSFLAHRDVVRPGSALAAAAGGTCLRRERHNRELVASFGEFSRLSQRRFAGAAGLEDGENASARARWLRAD